MDRVDFEKMRLLLQTASRVVPLVDVYYGDRDPMAIGMRHDVDDKGWESTMPMARWEAAMGFRSTYYFLHTAPYWGSREMRAGVQECLELGHEIGLHNNALAESKRTKMPAYEILHGAALELRMWSGLSEFSTAAHGDPLCSYGGFANYQIFEEATGNHLYGGFKSTEELGIKTYPLSDFNLTFMGDWISRPWYLTDSGGEFDKYTGPTILRGLDHALAEFPFEEQLMILQHPDWWPAHLYL